MQKQCSISTILIFSKVLLKPAEKKELLVTLKLTMLITYLVLIWFLHFVLDCWVSICNIANWIGTIKTNIDSLRNFLSAIYCCTGHGFLLKEMFFFSYFSYCTCCNRKYCKDSKFVLSSLIVKLYKIICFYCLSEQNWRLFFSNFPFINLYVM